jgi:hypothetical protein
MMQERQHGNDEAKHLLRKMLLYGGAEVTASHQWVSEVDRWKELVFALLTQMTKLPQSSVRVMTDHLLHLELLHIPALTQLLKGKRLSPEFGHPHARRIIQSLQEGGFSKDEAVKGLTVVCEAAAALSKHFSGKIQLYLRSYAERMVKEAHATFHFSHMDHRAVRYAFTFWLQNVLNMPLSLQKEAVKSFAKAHGLTGRQLFDAADELDVNVGLVDDLVHHFHSTSQDETTGRHSANRASKK